MGWFLITIALPLVVPVALLLCMKATPIPIPPERMNPITLVKDGQLCWAAIAFCASGMYELMEQIFDGVDYDRTWVGFLSFNLIATMVVSGVLAASGPVFPTDIGCPSGLRWYRHYKLLAFSMVMVVLASATYAIVHYGLLGPTDTEEKIHAFMDRETVRGSGPVADTDRHDLRHDCRVVTGVDCHHRVLSSPFVPLIKKIARAQRAMLDGRWTAGLLAFPSTEQAPQHATDQLASDL